MMISFMRVWLLLGLFIHIKLLSWGHYLLDAMEQAYRTQTKLHVPSIYNLRRINECSHRHGFVGPPKGLG